MTIEAVRNSNLSAIERGNRARKRVLDLIENPKKTSDDLLLKIVADNKDTEYGRKVGFSEIKTIDDFKKKVPLSTFDDYAEYVVRELTNGEKNLHSVYGVHQYNRSSGTMGNPKKIPMSEVSMDYWLDYTFVYQYALAAEKFGTAFADGKALSVCEASARAVIGDNKRYCGVSAQGVLDWNYTYQERFTSPAEAVCPDKDTDSRYLHARYGLADKTVSSLQTTFMTFILDLFHYIEHNWEMLCNDIESGKIDPSVKMTDTIRNKLESELVPMPERAAELRAIFSKGFDSSTGKKIWPNLTFICGISTGTFSAYLKNLRDSYVGDVPVFMMGISASEGAFTVPIDFNCSSFIPMAHTIFFEFLPLDETDPSKTYTIDDVPPGDYEMVVTTMSGLYRYRTRDAVRIIGRYKSLPAIEYLYRIDMCVNLNGEKTYEPALRKAMDLTSEEMGFKYTDFCVYPDTDVAPSCYRFFIEMTRCPPNLKLDELSMRLQKNLCIANPMLTYKFERELCGPVRSHILQDETYLLYRDKLIMMGGASTQVKPVKIIMNEAQLRFFKILIEKEYE